MNTLSTNSDLTLVIGATGKTGRRVAQGLEAMGRAVRIGSRSAIRSRPESSVLEPHHLAYCGGGRAPALRCQELAVGCESIRAG